MLEYTVSDDFAGVRLDKYLRQTFPDVPASHLFKMIRLKRIRVNAARAQVGQLLSPGDKVSVRGREEELLPPERPRSQRSPLPTVLYEDEWVLAMDKPSGMAAHPGSGITSGTAVDVVRDYLGPRATRNEFSASPAHRLDRDTSGVLLVAKRRRAMVALTEVFTRRGATKRYLALVRGPLTERRGLIDAPLPEHQQSRASRERRGVNLQPARTRWERLDAAGDLALVRCTIETGRTHQIRRHFASIGHPLAGDGKHGDFPFNRELKRRLGLKRLFLHAEHLEFPHPEDGRRVVVDADLPVELKQVLERAGLRLPTP
jgi:23S rRNA pseudouridine955/2504/2580 synthase